MGLNFLLKIVGIYVHEQEFLLGIEFINDRTPAGCWILIILTRTSALCENKCRILNLKLAFCLPSTLLLVSPPECNATTLLTTTFRSRNAPTIPRVIGSERYTPAIGKETTYITIIIE